MAFPQHTDAEWDAWVARLDEDEREPTEFGDGDAAAPEPGKANGAGGAPHAPEFELRDGGSECAAPGGDGAQADGAQKPSGGLEGNLERLVLTALVWSEKLAPLIAAKLAADDFSTGPQRQIATAALEYLAKFQRPARRHLEDLLEHEINNNGRDGQFLASLLTIMAELAPGLDEEYVLTRFDDFVVRQRMLAHANAAGELLMGGEIERARRQLFAAASVRPASIQLQDPWSEPVPPKFDPKILTDEVKVLRNFVVERAETTGFDPVGFLGGALSTCSAALDGSIRLQM